MVGDDASGQPQAGESQDARPTLAPGRPVASSPGPRTAASPTFAPGQAHDPRAETLPLAPTLRPAGWTPTSAPPPGNVTWMQTDGAVSAAPPAEDDAAPTLPAAGDVIGDFVVVELLGEGGMGAVFRARQGSLRRECALKVLQARQVGDDDAVERFMREARSAAAVHHPNVVSTFAAGKDPASKRLFIAMELVPGGDAETLAVSAGGRLPERRAVEVIRDCARGLVAIEQAGLVHRDIKPENIFLAADGAAKLGDLGLARRQSGDDRLTQTGFIVGTPCFMSPEQANGDKDVDSRTDIYSLGVSLFRLLTGQRAFDGGSVPAILYRVTSEPPPDPRALVPSLSREVCAVMGRAMAKDRADRPANAAAFLADLEALLAGTFVAPAPVARVEAARAPGANRLALAMSLAALLALVLGALALAFAR